MDIWTRPSSGLGAVIGNSTATASAAKRSPASTALLFSLGGSSPPDGSSSSSSSRGNDDTDNYTSSSQTSGNNGGVFAAGAAFPCSSLGVALASPVQFTDSVAEGGGIAAGGGAKVALRLRAGQASGRGAITEVCRYILPSVICFLPCGRAFGKRPTYCTRSIYVTMGISLAVGWMKALLAHTFARILITLMHSAKI